SPGQSAWPIHGAQTERRPGPVSSRRGRIRASSFRPWVAAVEGKHAVGRETASRPGARSPEPHAIASAWNVDARVGQADRSMRRWLIAGVLAVTGLGCSLLGTSPPEPTRGRLRPTCADVEQDACIAEAVTVNARQLQLSETEYRSLDRRPVPVRCVLRETGVVESCHVLDSRGEDVDGRLVGVLAPRRYQPVTYKGKPVLVPYTFLLSFAPPPSEAAATAAVRLEVFRALLNRIPGRRTDGGVQTVQPLVCVGVGDDVADPPGGELDALRRSGGLVEPASSCWGLMQAGGGAGAGG